MNFLELASSRFSARGFSSKQIEEDKLLNILSAGRVAPTAKNNQPQQIYVIQSNEALERINKVSPCIYNANTVLMVCSNIDVCWSSADNKYNSAEMDASIVCTHMMLEAKDQGIDSCWVLRFDKNLVKELFDLPQNIEPFCLLPIGYIDENINPSERHFDRKPLEETVIRL